MENQQASDEDEFVASFARSDREHKSYKHSSATKVSSKSANAKNLETMLKKRYRESQKRFTSSINILSKECDKFGGKGFIDAQFSKHKLQKQNYAEYCAQLVTKNFKLPSLQHIKTQTNEQAQIEPKSKRCSSLKDIRLNKYFIDPSKRFKDIEQRTKYNWDDDKFILNILQRRKVKLEHEYLPQFIEAVKKKMDRAPVVCQYAVITKQRK